MSEEHDLKHMSEFGDISVAIMAEICKDDWGKYECKKDVATYYAGTVFTQCEALTEVMERKISEIDCLGKQLGEAFVCVTQQLAEAKRANLRQRVEDLTFHAMLFDNADNISMNEIFETAFRENLPEYDWNYDGDGERASDLIDSITDWLIEQGVTE